ncbi:MAG: dTDP-4-dehydrorhamnose 3,5-epimerase [Acidobacteriaceae bacterium]
MHIVEEFPSGVVLLEPEIYRDERGYFFESFNQAGFEQLIPGYRFVQDNQSMSRGGVLRGLHYQIRQPQGKLVRVLQGEIFDVAVDLRRTSPWFATWNAVRLSSEQPRMIWIPPGFAHGFLVLSGQAEVHYKTTDYYSARHERTILWNDAELCIEWPIEGTPILSVKDSQGVLLREADVYTWPTPRLATISDICRSI